MYTRPAQVHAYTHILTECYPGDRGCPLTAVDAQVLLQMVLVFKCFATFSALEFTIATRLCDVSLSDEGRGVIR